MHFGSHTLLHRIVFHSRCDRVLPLALRLGGLARGFHLRRQHAVVVGVCAVRATVAGVAGERAGGAERTWRGGGGVSGGRTRSGFGVTCGVVVVVRALSDRAAPSLSLVGSRGTIA